MHSTDVPPSSTTVSSPSLSLTNFDYDSDVSASQPPITHRPSNITHGDDVVTLFVSPDIQDDLATRSDISELRSLIQNEFSALKNQLSESYAPAPTPAPAVSVPETAFADALCAELAVQMAKVSALEEETRKLRSEKQGLWAELERTKKNNSMCTQLDAANAELQRVYVERQGLWDERAGLWRERQGLWDERADLWKERGQLWEERGELWALRDKLMKKVESLSKARNEGTNSN